MKRALALIALVLGLAVSGHSQGVSIGNAASTVIGNTGRPLSGAGVAICAPLATTAASVTSNLAVLTMASNPITSGFAAGTQIQVAGFTGGDTIFNGGSLVSGQITSGFTILSVTSSTITFALTHANASAASNGTVLQEGNTTTPCGGLVTVYTDPTDTVMAANPFTTDALGNWQVFGTAGTYYVQFYGPQIVTTLKTITGGVPTNPLIVTSVTAAKINKVVHVDGLVYACSDVGIAAAVAAAGVNSKVVVDGCSGNVPMAGTVTITEGTDVVLGAATFQPTVCPSFDLTGGGSTLEGQGPGSPTMNISPTVIQAQTGCTGALVRVNIGAGAKGGWVHDLMLDGNSKLATVTAGIELGPVSQVNRNLIERVSFNQLLTTVLADVGSQSQRLSHLHAQNVNIGLDLSSGQHKDFVVEFSRFICDVQCFIAGIDDAVAGHVSDNISYTGTDFEISGTASAGINIGVVNNVFGFHISQGWYEINGGATVSGTSLIKLGGAASTPVGVSITGAHFNGNSNATATHAFEFASVSFPSVFGNDISGIASQDFLVTSTTSFGEIFSNSEQTVSSRTGLVLLLGDTTLSNPQWKTPILMEALDGTAMLAMSKTGDANPRLRILNSGNIATGPGGATAPLVWAACGTTAGVCTLQNAPVMGGTAAAITGTGACITGSLTTQLGGSWGGSIICGAGTAASTLTITPGYTAPHGWNCTGTKDETTPANVLNQTSHGTTFAILTAASITMNDVIIFECFPY